MDAYVAGPSGSAKMNREMYLPAQPSKRKQEKKKKEERIDDIISELKDNYSRSAISKKNLPVIIQHTVQTKEGRAGVGKIIAKEPVICHADYSTTGTCLLPIFLF